MPTVNPNLKVLLHNIIHHSYGQMRRLDDACLEPAMVCVGGGFGHAMSGAGGAGKCWQSVRMYNTNASENQFRRVDEKGGIRTEDRVEVHVYQLFSLTVVQHMAQRAKKRIYDCEYRILFFFYGQTLSVVLSLILVIFLSLLVDRMFSLIFYVASIGVRGSASQPKPAGPKTLSNRSRTEWGARS